MLVTGANLSRYFWFAGRANLMGGRIEANAFNTRRPVLSGQRGKVVLDGPVGQVERVVAP